MPSLSVVSRINILTAIRDYDQQGAAAFLSGLGFATSSDEVLVERGKRYDARAVLAYAYGKATGENLTPDQVSLESLRVIVDHGFSVVSRSESERPKPARKTTRSTRPATPKVAAPAKVEPEVRLCPRCFTQLPVAGTCDFCE